MCQMCKSVAVVHLVSPSEDGYFPTIREQTAEHNGQHILVGT